MCGIAGFFGQGTESDVRRMVKEIHHRGPDDSGVFFEGEVGLGHARLSIIDLSPAGHQPMQNEDGTVTIAFNGEIYNFEQLRRTLSRPHLFKGKSDTEVVLHLYEEVGTKAFEMIQGMFAIALYDANKRELYLVRDRMGKKPLYWSLQGRTLLFGSELKALLVHPLFRKQIDLGSLNKYFLYEYVPTPHTIFKNTWKLEPGTILTWNGKAAKKMQFWKPTFLPKQTSFADMLDSLDRALEVSVKDRLISDVPLGIFLSGGLDSSAIAYYAAKANPGKVKTFSIGFTEKSFDESSYARQVAKHIGTEHYEKILSVKECLDLIPKIAGQLDEPMADASIVPTYLLSQFAREHVTVALGGDGGDELFCGYDTFLAHRLAGMYGMVPKILRTGFIERTLHALPTSHSNMSWDFRAKKFVLGFEENPLYRNQKWLGAFDRSDRLVLFKKSVWDDVNDSNEFDDIDRYLSETDSGNVYDKLGYIYERMYMMDQVLVKVDRSSMMNSLEVRAPFLDTRVVDLANQLPPDFKFRGLQRKFILKKLMESKLPRDIIYRKKKGFGMPVAEWLRKDLKPLCEDVLSETSINDCGLFNFGYIESLKQSHYSGKSNNYKQLWTLLIFMMWHRNFVAKK